MLTNVDDRSMQDQRRSKRANGEGGVTYHRAECPETKVLLNLILIIVAVHFNEMEGGSVHRACSSYNM